MKKQIINFNQTAEASATAEKENLKNQSNENVAKEENAETKQDEKTPPPATAGDGAKKE